MKLRVPSRATHFLAGNFYHERGDGQFLRFDRDSGYYGHDTSICDIMERDMIPVPEGSAYVVDGVFVPHDPCIDTPITPQEDEAWAELERRQVDRRHDPVNNPDHYTQGGIECIDAIEAALTPEEFRGYCKGNAIKYVWRERRKGGEESIAKAEWYLNRL